MDETILTQLLRLDKIS